MKYSALMKVILMDLSRLDVSSTTPAATTDTAMDREVLENILGMAQAQSVDDIQFSELFASQFNSLMSGIRELFTLLQST